LKALAWDPLDRYQTAQALADELKAYLAWTQAQGSGQVLHDPQTLPERPHPAVAARRLPAGAWAAMVLVLGLLAWLSMAALRGPLAGSSAHHVSPPRNPPVGYVPPCQPETVRLVAADLAAAAQTHAAEAVAWCQQAPLSAIPELASRAVRLQREVQRTATDQRGAWLPLAAEARALESQAAAHGALDAPLLTAWRRILDALAAADLGPQATGASWRPSDRVLVVATVRLPAATAASLGPGCLALGDDHAQQPLVDERPVAAALRLPLTERPPAPDVPGRPKLPQTAALTLDNTRNPYAFSCLVNGRRAVVAAGQFEVFPAAGPVELVFDPGRPGPVVRRLLAPGTYFVGVRSDAPAWDLFAGPGR
jgi:hypothetical protein